MKNRYYKDEIDVYNVTLYLTKTLKNWNRFFKRNQTLKTAIELVIKIIDEDIRI